MSQQTDEQKRQAAKEELERMKDPSYDPTDNCAPYGTGDYVRKEFRPLRYTKNNTVASTYQSGKQSRLIHDAKIYADGVRCYHCLSSLMGIMSCSLCNSPALSKYTFHRVYDDHVESNIPVSFLCWIVDTTRVHYLDRDWANSFDRAGICTPICTHCTIAPDFCGLFGTTVVGHGPTNGVCCAGGRRIATGLVPHPCFGGPLLYGWCPIGNEQWVCFPFIDPSDTDAFIEALKTQRAAIVQQHNIVVGKAGLVSEQPEDGEQERV